MSLIQTIISFVVALLILVSIHEFGHFYVARRCGVKVLRFSIGFGKVLWSWRDKQGTEYALAALPLGGYVKMLDEREAPVAEEERSKAFNNKTVWQRIAIVAAGPLANFLLAILLFWILLLQGQRDLIPQIGSVEPGSIAEQAGLEAGQEIIAIDNIPTPTWQALNKALLNRLGESGAIRFKVAYPDSHFTYESEGRLNNWLRDSGDPDPVAGLGITLYLPKIPPIVDEVVAGGAAETAGFVSGDTLISADGVAIDDWQSWVDYVRQHPGKSIAVVVERDARELTLNLVPESIKESGVLVGRVGLGAKAGSIPDSMIRTYEYSVPGAFVAGVNKTWETSGFVLLSVKKLILGEISTKNLSGPITIAKVAGSSAESGLRSFIGFVALLSVFLAVFNLLPIPVLDGGHLFYYFIEVIKGKPVSDRVQMLGYQVGLFLVISLSVLALYNDIMRL
ncbi:RIP metalloprotease RseP [Cellvibrio mixtus]|uniref:Zinc metalloprotease n=1 Tax=Cellvibrio mixtus TaxID=39650 RepID=A0A266Q482_9GAMM|nr:MULTISPECIES: RIP metalloprotease RseP [Cellvibrio]AQT58946.1 RIP metalloprotease RseP [Cellvibrio sp. PSBB023]OZY84436.1 RIP metalloprotease RseP [Cellvibrio mixtus]